jgi:hypothetical protein
VSTIVEPGQLRTAHRLSIIILILAAIASAGGLLLKGLYRDNALMTLAWRGNDLVTLFVVIPILAIALMATKRGISWVYLVWMRHLAVAAQTLGVHPGILTVKGPAYTLVLAFSPKLEVTKFEIFRFSKEIAQ